MSEKAQNDPCENCNVDWGCIGCNNNEKTFSEEYMKLLGELFGDD